MYKYMFLVPLFSIMQISSWGAAVVGDDENLIPPRITVKNEIFLNHGYKRVDPYYWVRDRENPNVLNHLKAENKYTQLQMRSTKNIQEEIYQYLNNLSPAIEFSDVQKKGRYYFFSKQEKSKSYPIYYRSESKNLENSEILLDVNQMSLGSTYTECPNYKISPNQKYILYACDFKGDNLYQLYLKDLTSKDHLNETALKILIPNINSDFVWARDSRHFFYTKQDPQTLRSHQLWRFDIKTQKHQFLYEEKDEAFRIELSTSLSENFVLLNITSTQSQEVRFIPSSKPLQKWKIFQKRKPGLEYSVQDNGRFFVVRSNHWSQDFDLAWTSLNKTEMTHWNRLVKPQNQNHLESFLVFRNHVVWLELKDLERKVFVQDFAKNQKQQVKIPTQLKYIYFHNNLDFNANSVRFVMENPIQPEKTIDVDFANLKHRSVHQKVILEKLDHFSIERRWMKARDGMSVPITLIYRKNLDLKQAPLFIYGYGAYGISSELEFSNEILPLIKQNFIYAIVHIRGGSERGRFWYEQGKMFKKLNSFYDFIDATQFLVKQKVGRKDFVVANGMSAGGLLMGGIANMRPDLYKAIVAEVPFVDVLTTMLDEDIPLTTEEYSEWGNPNIKSQFEYMARYSPYDNVQKKQYPHMLITVAMNDAQVPYWEGAKWALKLRDYNLAKTQTLLSVDFEAGHEGSAGKLETFKRIAFKYAFFFRLVLE